MKQDKTFSAILKNNLQSSFTHAITYVVAILFELFISINFYIRKGFFLGNGTSDLLLFFSAVPYISIIIVPSICYKFESSLYDNFVPLKSFKIVFSHYLSNLIVFSIFIIFLIPCALFINFFGSIDIGQLFIGIFFLFLYGSCIISICSFFNEIFTSPIVSFIVSALVLAIFNCAHLFVVYFSFSNIISNFIKYISFAWHFDAASKGIFDTRDFIYFIVTSFIFLFLSVIVVELKKGRNFSKKQKTSIILIFGISILILLNGNSYYKRFDFSKNKTFSISNYTKKLSENITDSFKITYYRSSSLSRLYPQIRDIQDFLQIYSSLNKNISFLIKDPDKDSSLSQVLENYGITSQQMRTIDNNSTQYLNVYSSIILEYQGNFTAIPFTMDVETLEYDLDIKLSQMIFNKNLVVNILCGNGMNFYEDYNYVIPWLNSQGFICNLLDLQDSNFINNLNKSSGTLLIFGDSEINIENAIAIENYILSDKGNAFLCLNPYSVKIDTDWSITQNQKTNLIEMVENWGIHFEEKIIADPSCAKITLYSQEESDNPFSQNSTYTKVLNYPLWASLMPQEYAKSGVTTFWAVPISINDDSSSLVKPILITSSQSYNYDIDKNSPSSLIQTNPFELAKINTSNKQKSTQIVGVELSGKLEGLYNYGSTSSAKIFIISDQYFVNSLMTGYIGGDFGDYRNFDFMVDELLYLSENEDLMSIHSKNNFDKTLYKITDEYTFVKYEIITLVSLIFIFPILIICLGVSLWIRKKIKLTHI